ncbi:SEC10/PgrA surface exclusion domain-containing protein [Streptococcus cristatus]|uniref:SEC10/PgrA surface exclusion domain-containing protein n=1 Tax=Streptococcus cristatus TaxID=45634 RepID=UPI002284A391|nr:SEC10/PgrA surface exclusion domain-containing protein [Streptococcus cristatus]MCY7217965.1 SEC10/PgrA surface exclusion domain-containing protein [Streptococcus cristatus]
MNSKTSKNNKKKIPLALAAGVALTSFSTLSVQADEQVDVTSTDNTVAEEKHVQNSPTTSIPQVEGVEVSNGAALVSKTPTKEVVGQAKEIKERADQAVEAQTPVVEEAKKQETATAGAEDSAKQALEQAEQKKKAATPEAIEGTKSAIGASKKEVTTHTEKIDSLKEQQNQVQGKKNAQEAVVKDVTEATNNQAKKVAGAEKKVQNAQDVLNGTGADKVIKEEKDAKKDLEAKKAIVKDAKKALEQSQDADAKKARKLDDAKELEAEQKTAFDQATDVLSNATQAHNEATSKRNVAKQNKDNAQAVLDGTGTTAILDERKNAQSDLATKEATLADATKVLDDAKNADAKKAEDVAELEKAKTDAERTSASTAKTLQNATDEANEASSKLGVAKQNKDNAQTVLDGTGTKAIFDERSDAESDLATKKSEFEDATTNLDNAKRADAKKAEQVAGATTSLKEATATLNQAESNLSDAQTAANQASDDLKNKKKAEKKAQETLDASRGKVAGVTNERNNAKSDLATKEDTLANATTNLEHAKGKDAEKAEQLRLLDEAKTQAEEEEATTKKAKTKAQGGANLASAKLQETTADEKDAKDSLASSESRLEGVTNERDNAEADLATKQTKKEDAKRKLEDAKSTDAQKRSDIQELRTLKAQQEDAKRATTQELLDATTAAENAENAKNEADKAVDTLEKQISAIKNLTIPQLPQNVITAYKTYLNDASEANKQALNNVIQAWYKGGKYDFGSRQFGWSDSLKTTVFKGWTNKSIVLPIDNTVVNLDNPTDEQIQALSHYYALLANNLQDQIWGTHNFIVTKESVQGIKNIAKNYANENKPYNSGHSHTALNNHGVEAVKYNGEVMNYTNTLSITSPLEKAPDTEKTHKATMSQLYREVYDSVIAFMTNDIHANFGHMKGMVGRVQPTIQSAVGGNVSYTKDDTGRMHFVQFAGKNARIIIERDPETGQKTETYVDEYYQNGIAKPLPTPFDTSKMEEDLVQAKRTQTSALATHNNAQRRLSAAKDADGTAKSELETTTSRLNTLLNTQDLTPNAERVLNTAKSELSQAELRNTNASTAYKNLTKEIETKRATHKEAEKALFKATVANKVAQESLEKATTAHDNALDKLNSIKDAIKRTKAIKDLTPDAQAKFDTAKAEHQTAETRLATAEKALTDLNNEITTNTDKLNTAKSELRQAEQTDKDAQATLKEATSVKNNASKALDAEKDALYKANAIKELTPEAQATFDQAELAYNTAKTRLENAETAVKNLNADLAVKRQALADAVQILKDAEKANDTAQTKKANAEKAHTKATSTLTNIQNTLASLLAIKDLTPDAQAKFDHATVEYKAAQTRLENAETAVKNLNAGLQEKRKALADAVKALKEAATLAKATQAELEVAQATYQKTDEELTATRKVIATLEATKDLTPDAQKAYDQALEAEVLAEKRLSDAKLAVENLTADVKTKQEALDNAQAELAQEEKALEALKAKQAQEEKVLATIQAQLDDLKAQEKAVRAEIAKIEDSIKEMEVLLDSLIHASENYEVAKEEYEKALEAHRLALQTLEAEQAKLNTLLQNQLDAKAQYEAVLLAYQKAYNKPQESLNHRHDSKVSNIEHKLVTDRLRTALSNPAYTYVGNKPIYGVNTTLPNTGSEDSLSLIGLGAMLIGLFGIKLRRKSE